MKIATLCFLVRNGEILLALKKQKIGAGKWNGYGGGVELHETVEETAVREVREEACVEIALAALDKRGVATFYFDGVPTCQVHIFFVREWRGNPQETDEMGKPSWFLIEDIPYGEMLLADKELFPLVLTQRDIVAHAYYNADATILLDFQRVN